RIESAAGPLPDRMSESLRTRVAPLVRSKARAARGRHPKCRESKSLWATLFLLLSSLRVPYRTASHVFFHPLFFEMFWPACPRSWPVDGKLRQMEDLCWNE